MLSIPLQSSLVQLFLISSHEFGVCIPKTQRSLFQTENPSAQEEERVSPLLPKLLAYLIPSPGLPPFLPSSSTSTHHEISPVFHPTTKPSTISAARSSHALLTASTSKGISPPSSSPPRRSLFAHECMHVNGKQVLQIKFNCFTSIPYKKSLLVHAFTTAWRARHSLPLHCFPISSPPPTLRLKKPETRPFLSPGSFIGLFCACVHADSNKVTQ